jgi:hypothetical protein
LLAKATVDFETRLKIQRDLIRRMDYSHLALLEAISLDDEAGQRISADELKQKGRIIDLAHMRVPLAMSHDGFDLLLPHGLPLTLPDILDPSAPPRLSIDQPQRFVKQLWQDRVSGWTHVDKTDYLIAQPIRKLTLLNDGTGPFRTGGTNAAWPRVLCYADGEGRHMALLFDPRKGKAFLIGGRFTFSVALKRAQPQGSLALAPA